MGKTDIFQTLTHFLFEEEMPGFKKENIKVSIKGSQLSIKGSEPEIKDGDVVYRKSKTKDISFDLPENADINDIVPTFRDGIMTIKIGKK